MSPVNLLEGGPSTDAAFEASQIALCLQQVRESVHIVGAPDGGPRGLVLASQVAGPGAADRPRLGTLPPLYPEWLGDRDFGVVHGADRPEVPVVDHRDVRCREKVSAGG